MTNQFSPLNEKQINALAILTESLQKDQLLWLNGYFQGLLSSFGPLQSEDEAIQSTSNKHLTILYGTHTGRSKTIAGELPDNDQTALILVGAGTGVAPYRSFLQHREANNRKGKTWLFFGERRFHSDFLYQVECLKLLKDGYLEKIDLAFSRDQEEKIYVQHRLLQKQKEIFAWLTAGASIYLCGDMKQMARDVQKALLQIFETQGGMNEEKAMEYLKKLKKEKRFQTDVY